MTFGALAKHLTAPKRDALGQSDFCHRLLTSLTDGLAEAVLVRAGWAHAGGDTCECNPECRGPLPKHGHSVHQQPLEMLRHHCQAVLLVRPHGGAARLTRRQVRLPEGDEKASHRDLGAVGVHLLFDRALPVLMEMLPNRSLLQDFVGQTAPPAFASECSPQLTRLAVRR